jgi:hypothetical protein
MAGGAAGFRIEGVNKLVRDLQALGLEVDDLKDVFADLAAKGATLAARFAPKRTGRLAGNIRGNRAKSKAVVTSGGRAVPYAGPLNYGWPARGIAPSNYLQRADEALRPYALAELSAGIDRKIKEKGLG